MNTQFSKIFTPVLLLVIVCFSLSVAPPQLNAESISWSTPAPTLYFGVSVNKKFRAWVHNPMVTVNYAATVTEIDGQGNTVRPIACGDTVPQGTRLKFSFVPHTYEDISWFGTGSAQDSPYGEWSATEPPTAERCAPKNLYAKGVMARSLLDLYGALAVVPPQKDIAITGGVCDKQGSDRLCTFPTAGAVSVNFIFSMTTGLFWGGIFEYAFPSTLPACSFGSGGSSIGPMQYEDNICTTTSGGCPSANPFGGGFSKGTCTESVDKKCTGSFFGGTKCTPVSHTTCVSQPSNKPYTLNVPAQNISCPITVGPAVPGAPTAPTVSGQNGASCVVGTPYTITMKATDPEGDTIRYDIDWDNNLVADQFVPNIGFVPSGTAQTATRTFATAGTKTINVLAEDSNTNRSGWTSFSFTCRIPSSVNSATSTNTNTNTNENNNGGTGSFSGAGNGTLGNFGGSTSPDLSIRAIPSLIQTGGTTHINWSATNVTSCTVSAPNGDLWNTIQSIVGGGNLTAPITQQTVYTLSCLTPTGTVKKTATVNVLPNFVER